MNGGPLSRRGLTIKQAKFAKHYAATNGNGTQAAKLAGYSPHRDPNDPATEKTLSVVAAENLAKPRVQKEVQRLMSKVLSADEVLQELTDIAKSTCEIKGSDKTKALELIGKNLKLWTDKLETSSPQEEQRRQILQELAAKYHLTERQAAAIVADVYGESEGEIIQNDHIT